jgi:hypothetical protein
MASRAKQDAFIYFVQNLRGKLRSPNNVVVILGFAGRVNMIELGVTGIPSQAG